MNVIANLTALSPARREQRRADGMIRRIALISADPHHESAGSLWLYQVAYREASAAAARWSGVNIPTGMWEQGRDLLRTYRAVIAVFLATVGGGLAFVLTAPAAAVNDLRWLTTGAGACLVVCWVWSRWSTEEGEGDAPGASGDDPSDA